MSKDIKEIKKILIANRGDSALRVLRTCKEIGVKTVVAYSTCDEASLAVKLADESMCIGPPHVTQSYLNGNAFITAAQLTCCDAIHPGIGFLAEDYRFAEAVEQEGLIFIGPKSASIKQLGDKISSKKIAKEIGFKTLDFFTLNPEDDVESCRSFAEEIGYPVMIKGSACGAGRGMRLSYNFDELASNLKSARLEAETTSGSALCFIEKFIKSARHFEVQILADQYQNCIHLGGRDCSVQRNYQKLIEEFALDGYESFLNEVAKSISKTNYCSTGTVEFLKSDDELYFMEMNTRLQIEHTVTEMVIGIDLVEQQIKIASGMPLDIKQSDIKFNGFAIECRINAEDHKTFAPSIGDVEFMHFPGGNGVRIDSQLFTGANIPPYYDNMIVKIITHSSSRNKAIKKMIRCIKELLIAGINTNSELHLAILEASDFMNDTHSLAWAKEFFKEYQKK